MAVAVRTSRASVWLEGLGDWSWPGRAGTGALEILPPPWVPASPPRHEPAGLAPRAPVGGLARRRRRARLRRVILGTLIGAIAAVSLELAHTGQLTLGGLTSLRRAGGGEQPSTAIRLATAAAALPALEVLERSAAGSWLDRASYHSAALGREGSFLVYLPSGYGASNARYPVLYMLPGQDQSDSAFVQIGLQDDLDHLIGAGAIPPLIAVAIQGGPGANRWRDGPTGNYESYVLEVQQLVDRMLPTLASRDSRAIVGDSMGGYGAMHIALANPYRFGVAESWLGFFDGLQGQLHADRPVIRRLGLHAFVYGGEEDHIANPEEDLPFAHELEAEGADAHGAVYPGEHSLTTVEAHLADMLVYAGRALQTH